MSYFDTCKFTLDWLQGVLPFNDVRQLFRALGEIDERLKPEMWQPFGSFRNYRTRFICQGKASVSIAYNDDPLQDPYNKALWYSQNNNNDDISLIAENHPYNPGIFVSISGDGLRWLNQNPDTVKNILKYLRFQKFKCSRIDFACDVFDPKNELVPTVLKAFKNAVPMTAGRLSLRSKIRRTSGKNGSVKLYPYTDTIRPGNKTIWNCTLGDHGSSFGMFRCYDKWFEIASGRLSDYKSDMLGKLEHQYWYRLEYELHNGTRNWYAASIFNQLADEDLQVNTAFGWCVDNMFDVVKINRGTENVSERAVSPIWSQFLSYCEYFVQLGVELISTPWVDDSSVEKTIANVKRMAKYFVKVLDIFNSRPDIKNDVVEIGRRKLNNDIVSRTRHEADLDRLRLVT